MGRAGDGAAHNLHRRQTMTAAHKTAEQHTIALALVREIRAASDWTHPARIGLGRLMGRAHAMQTTAADIQELTDMLHAVKR